MYPQLSSLSLKTAGILVLLSQGLWHVTAQQVTFNFTVPKEDADPTGEALIECSMVHINLKATDNNTFDVVPPFYLISAEVGGTVTTDLLHGEEREGGTLIWDAVRHAPGGFLFSYVVDSIGNMGKIGSAGVVNGTTSNCRPSVPFSLLNMTLDKSQLLTCESLLIGISGGAKPYTVTIIGQPDQLVQNYTMGPEDDTFEFVNKNIPGYNMIFMVSDSNASWSFATSFVMAVAGASVDPSCDGRVSNSFRSSAAAMATSQRSHSRAGPIAGGVVGGITLIAVLILVLVVYKRRRRSMVKLGKGRPVNLTKDEVTPLFRVNGLVTPFRMTGREPPVSVMEKGRGSDNEPPVTNREDRNDRRHPPHGAAQPASLGYAEYRSLNPDSLPASAQSHGQQTRSSQPHEWDVEDLYELPPEYMDRSIRR